MRPKDHLLERRQRGVELAHRDEDLAPVSVEISPMLGADLHRGEADDVGVEPHLQKVAIARGGLEAKHDATECALQLGVVDDPPSVPPHLELLGPTAVRHSICPTVEGPVALVARLVDRFDNRVRGLRASAGLSGSAHGEPALTVDRKGHDEGESRQSTPNRCTHERPLHGRYLSVRWGEHWHNEHSCAIWPRAPALLRSPTGRRQPRRRRRFARRTGRRLPAKR